MKRWMRAACGPPAACWCWRRPRSPRGAALADRKMNRTIALQARPVALRSDAQAIERGRYLFASRGCVDCHGANGAGRTFIDDGHGLQGARRPTSARRRTASSPATAPPTGCARCATASSPTAGR